MNEDKEFVAEAKAFERAGAGGFLEGLLDNDISTRLAIVSQKDRFLRITNGICYDLIKNDKIKLSSKDVEIILQRANDQPNIWNLNPTTFILGYMASIGGNRNGLIQAKVDDAFELLKGMKITNIEPSDVIRYARLWIF